MSSLAAQGYKTTKGRFGLNKRLYRDATALGTNPEADFEQIKSDAIELGQIKSCPSCGFSPIDKNFSYCPGCGKLLPLPLANGGKSRKYKYKRSQNKKRRTRRR